jgi:5'-deoxynucleotidase YfbR-like HD superfamily hydrolase
MVDDLIRAKYGLPTDMSTVVKYADLTMLATERRDLDIDDGTRWAILDGIPCSDLIQIIPLRPGQAYGLFMNRFNELMEIRKCA